MLPFDTGVATASRPASQLEAMSSLDLLSQVLRHHGGVTAAMIVLDEFQTIGAAAAASPADFVRRTALPEAVQQDLRVVREIAARLALEPIAKRIEITRWSALKDYLRLRLANEPTEQLRILHLDHRCQLIRDELMATGTVNHAPVYVREIARRAIELSSSNLFIVHNHPTGDRRPSPADINITKEIVAAAKSLGITVLDHVIVAHEEIYSFRDNGLIKPGGV